MQWLLLYFRRSVVLVDDSTATPKQLSIVVEVLLVSKQTSDVLQPVWIVR